MYILYIVCHNSIRCQAHFILDEANKPIEALKYRVYAHNGFRAAILSLDEVLHSNDNSKHNSYSIRR